MNRNDYLTPGDSPAPGREGREHFVISADRDRIAAQLAADRLEAARGIDSSIGARAEIGYHRREVLRHLTTRAAPQRHRGWLRWPLSRRWTERLLVLVAGLCIGIAIGELIAITPR